MKKFLLLGSAALVMFACKNGGSEPDEDATNESSVSTSKIELKNTSDSLSCALGSFFGMQAQKTLDSKLFKSGGVDNEVFMATVQEVLDGETPHFTRESAGAYLQAFERKSQTRDLEKFTSGVGEKVKTASGLEYEVLEEGSGKQPTIMSQVKVHYHGTLPDGTVFDSSVERGEAIDFGLSNVIRGWTEGVQLMKEGARYKFYIPSDLAYGEKGAGQIIGPNQDLIFYVELIEVMN